MTQLESPAVDPSRRSTLTSDEREELLRLRREVEVMRSAPPPPARRKFRWRSLLATVLINLSPARASGAEAVADSGEGSGF